MWALTTGSLFLIQTTVEEFFMNSNILVFKVRDYDAFKHSRSLGRVDLSKRDVLNGTGERIEYDLSLPATSKWNGRKKPILVLRYRHASEEDIAFIQTFVSCRKRNMSAVYAEDSFLSPKVHKRYAMQKQKRKSTGKVIQYRLKPGPDSECELETTWMTKKEIKYEAMKPSKNWIESGSGQLGKIYVEVIGCDNLPNLDFSASGRDKSDPFISMVFEDCAVNTDVINDCLSPRWMPWSQRAFVFNVLHPTSQIMVGVFDYDRSLNPVGEPFHDVVGRCCINVANCRPETVYTMKYNLHHMRKRGQQQRGSITIRLRVEWESERLALLAAATSTETYHDVSVANKQYFRTTYYTVSNEVSLC